MAKLLQGSPTLTPINILSNSTFKDASFPSTINIGTTSSSSNYEFAHYFYLNLYGGVGHNITLIRSINSVRVYGEVEKTGTSSVQVRIINWLTLKANKIYTVFGTIKENISTISTVAANISGFNFVGNTYYNQITKDREILKNGARVIRIISDNDGNYGYSLSYTVYQSGSFDITFSDCGLYEGGYINPPYYESLDSQINSKFLLNDLSNLLDYRLKSLDFGKGWLRVCHIGKINTAFEVKSTVNLWKAGGNARTMRVVIKFWALRLSGSEAWGKIEVESYQTSSGLRFTAARFAKDSEGDIFLEVFNNVATSNNDLVYVTSVDNTSGYDSSGIAGRTSAPLSMYKVNDSTGDNDTLLGNQVNIGAVTDSFSIV